MECGKESYGIIINMNDLINKIFENEDFPSWPRKQIGIQLVGDKEKPIYSFYKDKSDAYVVENKDVSSHYTNAKVFKDCVCIDSIDTCEKKFKYVFWFSTYNLDEWYIKNGKPVKGNFEMLIMGTEYC